MVELSHPNMVWGKGGERGDELRNKHLCDQMDQLSHHAVGVIGFGIWMSTNHDGCRKSLTLPVLGLGVFILLISVVGFIGALKNISILLWIYLGMLGLILVAILVFTVLAFIITNNGSGHTAAGLR